MLDYSYLWRVSDEGIGQYGFSRLPMTCRAFKFAKHWLPPAIFLQTVFLLSWCVRLGWGAVSASLVLSFSCLRFCLPACPSWLGCCVRRPRSFVSGLVSICFVCVSGLVFLLFPVLSPSLSLSILSPSLSGMLCPPCPTSGLGSLSPVLYSKGRVARRGGGSIAVEAANMADWAKHGFKTTHGRKMTKRILPKGQAPNAEDSSLGSPARICRAITRGGWQGSPVSVAWMLWLRYQFGSGGGFESHRTSASINSLQPGKLQVMLWNHLKDMWSIKFLSETWVEVGLSKCFRHADILTYRNYKCARVSG